MKRVPFSLQCALAALPLFCLSCNQEKRPATEAVQIDWTAEHLATLDGFDIPECAMYHAGSGVLYVANIESAPDEYWKDDGKSFISTIGAGHQVIKQRWLDSTEQSPIHAAKGMCVLGNHLYFTDNTRVMRCDLKTGEGLEQVTSGYQKANDLVSDGVNVWLSDNAAGKVYCISPDGKQREIPAPQGVNGLTFDGKRLYAVSWDLHEVYELDPTGEAQPVAFGLAEHFTNLDGIEVLCDGTFVVSDFKGNKVSAIGPDRTVVKTLIELDSPADIGLNRQKHLLYVPHFLEGKVSVYRLK